MDGGWELLAAACVAEKFVDVLDTHARGNALVADMAVLLDQVLQQGDFQIVTGTEIRMSAFAGPYAIALPIPVQSRFTEAGAGRDDAAVSSASGAPSWMTAKSSGFNSEIP